MARIKKEEPKERPKLSVKVMTIVLTEAGYRCAVPTCRGVLALDIHHIWEVSASGGDDPSNLIALCPTCHALRHRGTISSDSIYAYKAMIVALSQAFDAEAVDRLLFLEMCVFRRKPDNRFGLIRTPISAQTGQRFRFNPDTFQAACVTVSEMPKQVSGIKRN